MEWFETKRRFKPPTPASQIADDLNVALNFTQRTATAATFTVPDRLNLGTPQVVSYSWAGTAGAPLLRQFNGGTSSTLLAGVQNFSLTYTPRLMGPTPTPTEQVVRSHDAAVGTFKDNPLDTNNWASECFSPSLPLGTSSYTIPRVRLMLKAGPQNNAMVVSLATPNALNQPSSNVIAQTTVYESALSNQYEWIDIPFTGTSNLNPLQPLCIVMQNATSNPSPAIGAVQVDQALLSILSNTYWSATTNAGTSWSLPVTTTSARFYVYATVP